MKRTRTKMKVKPAMLIVTGGEFEAMYFSQVRKDCRYSNLTVRCAQGADSLGSFISKASAARLKGKYDSVWAFFSPADFPVTAQEIKEAQEYAQKKKVNLGWAFPSLSLWFYLHFKSPQMAIDDPEPFAEALPKQIKSYEETTDFLLGEGQNLHLELFTNFSKAVSNSMVYNRTYEVKFGIQATNLPEIYAEIHRICGKADLTHNQKMLTKRT